MTSKLSAMDFSLTVSPRPGTLSSRSINPSYAFGSPLKMYQNNSFPTSTSTTGKYSAIGEFRLAITTRSEEHTSELQSHSDLVCRLLLEKKKNKQQCHTNSKHSPNPISTP